MTDPYAAFAPFYDAWSSQMTEDIDFYVRRALEISGPIVELGAGTGRVSIPIAEAGRDVIAVDASSAMIELGRRKAAAAGVEERITWVHSPMQTFVAERPVELVIIPFRSFIHLTTVDEQLETLYNIHRSLMSNGRLVLNLFIPDPVVMARRHGKGEEQGEFIDQYGRRCVLVGEPTYELTTQLMHLRAICEVRENGTAVEAHSADLEACLIYPREMEHLLARAGFEIEALYGWFDERPLTEESREMIWVARKP